MDNLFMVLFLISFIAVFVFIILSLIQFVKKDKVKGMKQLKFAGASIVIFIISFIGFGMTTDSTTTTSNDDKAEKVEVSAEAEKPDESNETDEERIAREQKEAEEKALAEEKAKEEAAAKAKAEEEARLKAEAEEKARKDAEAKAIAEKKANAQPIDYAQLKKNPDRYAGEYVKYSGEILQILEGDNITNIRLAVTKNSYGYDFNDVIFIEYDGYTDYVDGDIITVYGEIYGAYSYESQAGYNISLPGLIAESFE